MLTELSTNIVSLTKARSKINVVDAFPDTDELPLPFIVIEFLDNSGEPLELGSTSEDFTHYVIWNIFALNERHRDFLLENLYLYFRDTGLNFYNLKVVNKEVVLDTASSLGYITFDMQSYRQVPVLSDHPYDRYRGEIHGTVNHVY